MILTINSSHPSSWMPVRSAARCRRAAKIQRNFMQSNAVRLCSLWATIYEICSGECVIVNFHQCVIKLYRIIRARDFFKSCPYTDINIFSFELTVTNRGDSHHLFDIFITLMAPRNLEIDILPILPTSVMSVHWHYLKNGTSPYGLFIFSNLAACFGTW